MKLRTKALLGLFCLMFLAACGANATPAAPTPTETATQQPTSTLAPTETPQPSETPTLAPTGDAAALTPAAPGANPTAGAGMPAANPTTSAAGGSEGVKLNPAPDKYTYLGQDVTDGTQFLPNRTVTITWTIKNTGTTGWTKDYTLRYFAGPKPAKDFYNFTKDVPVNDTINFVVTFTTPAEPGNYDLWFKLTNSAGQNFGDLDLVFTVSNNPQKATATPAK